EHVPIKPAAPLMTEHVPIKLAASLMTEHERIVACIREARKLMAAILDKNKTTLICRAVATVYGVMLAEIMGPGKRHYIIEPRHIAMTIAYALLDCGTPAIGR